MKVNLHNQVRNASVDLGMIFKARKQCESSVKCAILQKHLKRKPVSKARIINLDEAQRHKIHHHQKLVHKVISHSSDGPACSFAACTH